MAINTNNALNSNGNPVNTNTNNGPSTEKKVSVNYLFFARGFLAADAKVFHAQCTNPQCKRWVSLYDTTVCPICGSKLDYLRGGKDNRPMTVGELTFLLAIGRESEDIYKKKVVEKGKALPVHRVKMYAFADDDGNLPDPHPEFANLKKGAMIEVKSINHIPEYTPFTSKDGQTSKMEVMVHIFEAWGDYVKILRGQKKQDATTAYNVDANGNPAPVAPSAPTNLDLASLAQNPQAVAMLQTLLSQLVANPKPAPAPAPAENTTPAPATMSVGEIPFPDLD